MLGRLLIVWLVFRGAVLTMAPPAWSLQKRGFRGRWSQPRRAGQGLADDTVLCVPDPVVNWQFWSGLVSGARPDKPTRLTRLDFRPEMTETFNQETTEVPLPLQERGLP